MTVLYTFPVKKADKHKQIVQELQPEFWPEKQLKPANSSLCELLCSKNFDPSGKKA